jgi:NAD(P)-dependent dehydrogenase (short-subunit alcohol dehydrogenase family)
MNKGGKKMGRLDNKVAIVTGSGSGIGKATALLFAKEGAKVVVVDIRNDGEGENTVKEIQDAGGKAIFVKTDVSKAKDVENMVKAAVKEYGKLDILVNNAGIAPWGSLTEYKEEDFDVIVDVNIKGVWLGMKYAIPEMIKTGGGSIVNISSIDSDAGHLGGCIYGATKSAVNLMTKVAAIEYAEQYIRVNTIKPGPTATPLAMQVTAPEQVKRIEASTPQKRWGKPEELAQAILFFASDEASRVTGQKLAVDGGIEARGHLDE